MLLLPQREQLETQEGPPAEVEGAGRLGPRETPGLGLAGSGRQGGEVDPGQREGRRADDLEGTGLPCRVGRAESLVAADDLPESARQEPRIEAAQEAERRGDVVGDIPRLDLVEKPEPLLGEGEGKAAAGAPREREDRGA